MQADADDDTEISRSFQESIERNQQLERVRARNRIAKRQSRARQRESQTQTTYVPAPAPTGGLIIPEHQQQQQHRNSASHHQQHHHHHHRRHHHWEDGGASHSSSSQLRHDGALLQGPQRMVGDLSDYQGYNVYQPSLGAGAAGYGSGAGAYDVNGNVAYVSVADAANPVDDSAETDLPLEHHGMQDDYVHQHHHHHHDNGSGGGSSGVVYADLYDSPWDNSMQLTTQGSAIAAAQFSYAYSVSTEEQAYTSRSSGSGHRSHRN
ncbi:hypothetical protein BX600DRAFT_516290 [Xylariales sp. PMI_506]|nr:hypothetical protein BX600DRAFT_516290 [Xylariales sp. PMI_506]